MDPANLLLLKKKKKKKKTIVNFKLLLRAAQYLREKTLRHSKAKN